MRHNRTPYFPSKECFGTFYLFLFFCFLHFKLTKTRWIIHNNHDRELFSSTKLFLIVVVEKLINGSLCVVVCLQFKTQERRQPNKIWSLFIPSGSRGLFQIQTVNCDRTNKCLSFYRWDWRTGHTIRGPIRTQHPELDVFAQMQSHYNQVSSATPSVSAAASASVMGLSSHTEISLFVAFFFLCLLFVPAEGQSIQQCIVDLFQYNCIFFCSKLNFSLWPLPYFAATDVRENLV